FGRGTCTRVRADQDDRYVPPRQDLRRFELQQRQRQVPRSDDVSRREIAPFGDVEQRQLASLLKPRLQTWRRNACHRNNSLGYRCSSQCDRCSKTSISVWLDAHALDLFNPLDGFLPRESTEFLRTTAYRCCPDIGVAFLEPRRLNDIVQFARQ